MSLMLADERTALACQDDLRQQMIRVVTGLTRSSAYCHHLIIDERACTAAIGRA